MAFSISDEVCRHCNESFGDRKAKLLPCLHTHCVDCLEINRDLEDDGTGRRLVCPTCKSECAADEVLNSPFLQLKTNLDLELQEESGNQPCSACNTCSPASSYCLECNDFLCSGCVSAHKRVKQTRDHRLINLSSDSQSQEQEREAVTDLRSCMLCQVHPMTRIRLYCVDCKIPICVTCRTQNHREHSCHVIDNTNDIGAGQRETLRDELKTLKSKVRKMTEQKFVEKMSEKEKQVKGQKLKLTELRSKFYRCFTELQSFLEGIFDEQLTDMRNRKEEAENFTKKAEHTVNFVEQLLQISDNISVLTVKSLVSKNISALQDQIINTHTCKCAVEEADNNHAPEQQAVPTSSENTVIVNAIKQEVLTSGAVERMQCQSSVNHDEVIPGNSQIRQESEAGYEPMDNSSSQTDSVDSGAIHMDTVRTQPDSTKTLVIEDVWSYADGQGKVELSCGDTDQNLPCELARSPGTGQNLPHESALQSPGPGQNLPHGSAMSPDSLTHIESTALPGAALRKKRKLMDGHLNHGTEKCPEPSTSRQGLEGPSELSKRTIIWKGPLEWQDKAAKSVPARNGHCTRSINCRVSIGVHDSPVNTSKWPQQLTMQLMKQSLLDTDSLRHHFRNSRRVTFHLHDTNHDDYMKLDQVLHEGYAGCVNFPINSSCDLQFLMLRYSEKKRSYIGLIPDDQKKVVADVKEALTQHKQRPLHDPSQDRVFAYLDSHRKESMFYQDTHDPKDPWEDLCSVCWGVGEFMCCDFCPRVYHMKCYVPTLEEEPSSPWQCILCQDDLGSLENASTSVDSWRRSKRKMSGGMTDGERKICERILLELHRVKEGGLFHEPVPIENRAYYKMIKKPMDFLTIKDKLKKENIQHYGCIEEFLSDMKLVFSNCYTFNTSNDDILEDGERTNMLFKALVQEYLPQYSLDLE